MEWVHGRVTKWLCGGLQIRLRGFKSLPALSIKVSEKKLRVHQLNNDISPCFQPFTNQSWQESLISIINKLVMHILLDHTLTHLLLFLDYFLFDWTFNLQKITTGDFSWADYKYLLLIAVMFSITIALIVQNWRKRKWR